MRHGLGITSGEYTIYVDVNGVTQTRQVYCDMVTDGGGWTVGSTEYVGDVMTVLKDMLAIGFICPF